MGRALSFSAPHGGGDVLALRHGPSGKPQIIYDDGVGRRIVWQVLTPVAESRIVEALRIAATRLKIVPALLEELKKRAILVDRAVA
ncbi:hypothetical protein [Gemmobacter serpentinus]|uniref:hypothetical protein n=1 Tax=Gemmobacter serpentinus TaxID=2652247 RepID=UPI00124F4894|nr:hypothetical protein [Gemmobacter serpentinus]